jgi:hypothetical protein
MKPIQLLVAIMISLNAVKMQSEHHLSEERPISLQWLAPRFIVTRAIESSVTRFGGKCPKLM